MTNTKMLLAARKLPSICTHTQPNENVVIVIYPEIITLAETLAITTAEIGAEPIICVMPMRRTHGQESTFPVADVFFVPVMKSITHT
jgi:hypothetical protein